LRFVWAVWLVCSVLLLVGADRIERIHVLKAVEGGRASAAVAVNDAAGASASGTRGL
jgi:hypothetical protein